MLEFLKLLQELRISQKKYARTRKGADLIECNYLADQIDPQIEQLIREFTKKKFERVKPSDEVMDIFDLLLYHDEHKEDIHCTKDALRSGLFRIGIDITAYHQSKKK